MLAKNAIEDRSGHFDWSEWITIVFFVSIITNKAREVNSSYIRFALYKQFFM